MRTTLIDRLRGLFARDKDAYWWNHWTDEEKQLRRMDVWQLAKVINEARVRNLAGEAEKLIVAEHMLSERLARIQARPGYMATVAGLIGIVGGAFLTSALQKPETPLKCACECQNGYASKQNGAAPTQVPVSPVAKPRVPAVKGMLGKSAQAGESNGKSKQ
jgi:hypothetical protein